MGSVSVQLSLIGEILVGIQSTENIPRPLSYAFRRPQQKIAHHGMKQDRNGLALDDIPFMASCTVLLSIGTTHPTRGHADMLGPR